MQLYRMITDFDDATFCHRVSEALSNGWQLHGSASLTFDQVKGRVICGQAIVKEVPDSKYTPDISLGDY